MNGTVFLPESGQSNCDALSWEREAHNGRKSTLKHARIINKKVRVDSIGYVNPESDPSQWCV